MQKVGDEKVNATTLTDRLDVSNLTYLAKDDSNVVVERTQKIQYADSPVYASNQEIVINWQTGNDYISGRDSMLRLNLKITGQDSEFGAGFVTNLFNRVRVVSRSGVVVSHIDKYNLLTYFQTKYSRTKAWQTQQGTALLGYKLPAEIAADDTQEFLIPLSLIAPIFDIDELLPNQLCKGLRLEIKLERPEVALVAVDNGADYEVSSVQCILDTYRLSDGAQSLLNSMSKNSGLVIQYEDHENSSFTLNNAATSSSVDVRKTASMAVRSIAVLRKTITNDEGKVDSFGSKNFEAERTYQWRIGSTYLGVQAVLGPVQGYAQAAYCYSKLKHKKELGVEFKEEWNAGDNVSQNIMCCDISRYWLANSGLAISNSTSLNFDLQNIDGAGAKKLDIFLTHVRSLQIFLENIIRSD